MTTEFDHDGGAITFYSKSNEYFEFSNFSPHCFEIDGAYWPMVEHYFQAQKFPAHPDYQEQLLLETGEKELIENAPSDDYWGCGRTGTGKNRLGVLLMELRSELRQET